MNQSRKDSETPGWDVVVVGGANTDYLVRGPRLPGPGETAQGDEFQEAPGGKGANQAVAAARLGARVAFVGRVGSGDRGDQVLARLHQEGVDTHYVVRDHSTYTGVALVMVAESGEKQILAASGANRHLSIADVQAAAEAIRHAKVVLTQLETSLEITETVARLGHEAGAKVLLDPSPPVGLPDELLHQIAVIKPNSREAQALTGIEVKDRTTAHRAAEALLRRGVGAVAVQAGEEGNLIVWREGEMFMAKVPVKSVDATGAGDAFIAALGVMLAEGKSLAEAGPFANAAAALTTTVLGAQAALPYRDAVLQLLAQYPGEARGRPSERTSAPAKQK